LLNSSARYYGGMYVLDVIPLSSTAPQGSLSYRHRHKLAPGRIVSVRLRRKRVPGVVISCVPLLEAKATLKTATFVLSGEVEPEAGCIPQEIMEAVERVASWHASTGGAVLSALFLELIKSDADLSVADLEKGPGFALDPVELPLAKRANRYRAAITDALARDSSALLVVSTLAEVEYWKRELGEFAPLILTGSLSGARRKAMLKRAEEARTLIIATPSFSWIPVTRLGVLITERIGAGGFKLPKRPYLDIRVALLELARAREILLMQGDFPLPLEYRAGTRQLAASDYSITVLDSRKDESLPALGDEPWSAVPKPLMERLRDVSTEGGRSIVLAVRKGYAPVVICRDCGQTLKDERGKVFAFFAGPSGERIFRTSDGKSIKATETKCPRCDSWNLLPLGVGSERVYEELVRAFPGAVTLFDTETVRTAAAARKVLAGFSYPGSIIVGTEAMLPWILANESQPVELACVASADALLALPFWRARERFVRLGYLLAECAKETLIATRLPDDAAAMQLADPVSNAFFAEEIALRRALNYPPFGTLISLQFEGKTPALDALESRIRESLQKQEGELRSVPDRFVRPGVMRRSLVLLLEKDAWPDPKISRVLAGFPPSVRVMIDPEAF
jgi:primosomal protein N'